MNVPHILQRPATARLPRAVVCLSIRSALDDVPGRRGVYQERLISWHACGWTGQPGRTTVLRRADGEQVSGLWRHLAAVAKFGRPVWVVCRCALSHLSLLQVWSMCQNGGAAIRGEPILGSAPTIVSVSRPVRLLIMGLHNWTPWSPPTDLPHEQRAELMAQFMRDMLDWVAEHDWGGLQLTAGSQALHTFRWAYLHDSIVCHRHPVAQAMEHEAYVGGRCEPYILGRPPETVYEMDVRSAYGAACVDADVPCLLEHVHGPMTVDALRWLLDKKEVIANVEIETDEPAYPVRHDGRVLYATGRFWTAMHTPELCDALALRRIRAVSGACCYAGYPALSECQLAFGALREEAEATGREGLAGWAKHLMVALPGALGRRRRRWLRGSWPEHDHMTWGWSVVMRGTTAFQVRTLAGRTAHLHHGGYEWDTAPAIAGWVSSAARTRLLGLIRQAGWSNVYYVDTDSVHANRAGALRLCPHTDLRRPPLGALVLKGIHPTAWYGGYKHYNLSGRWVHSGVPSAQQHDAAGQGFHALALPPSTDLARDLPPSSLVVMTRAGRVTGFAGRRFREDGTSTPRRLFDGTETTG